MAAQDLDAGETVAVHVVSLDGLGDRLAQSHLQVTRYRAMEFVGR